MAYVVTQRCLGAKNRACVEVCPVDCFYDVRRLELNEKYGVAPADANDDERVGVLMIHPDECIDCGACVTECPVEAIFDPENVPKELVSFVGLNADVTRGLSNPERRGMRCSPTHYKTNGSKIAR